MRRILLAGCGFLGEAAAFLFKNSQWQVVALTSGEKSAALLRDSGLDAFAADLGDEQSILALRQKTGAVDRWIHCASSGGGGESAYHSVYLQGVHSLLRAYPEAKGVFTGSTSVYAQTDGSEVTEESPTQPQRATGKILLEAEKVVLEAGGLVVRLAGIYGPGRSILLRKFLDKTARVEGDGNRWINQIHHADAARALLFLLSNDHPAGIYNVADDHPWRQRDFYRELASRLNQPLPADAPIDLNRKRGWTSKKVSNRKLREAGWAPAFPNYFDALQELLTSMEKSG